MANCNSPQSWYLTLPSGAVPYRLEPDQNPPINELFWPNRHTYRLSSPNIQGDLPWISMNGFTGTFTPNLGEGSDSILTERAVFQRGKTTTALRPDAKMLSAQVFIGTPDRCEFDRFTIRALGHIMSTDLATSIPCEGEYDHIGMERLSAVPSHLLPFAYERPSPWRITYETCFDGNNPVLFHRDVSAMWLADDPDHQGDAHTLSTQLIMFSDNADWRSDVINPAQAEYQTNQNVLPTLADEPTDAVNGVPIFYNGTSRTGWTIEFNIDPLIALGNELTSISIVDVTDVTNVRWQRFPHVNFPNNGWAINPGDTVVWSSQHQAMFTDDGAGNITEGLHLQASIEYARQWSTFHFVPGRSYRIALETNYVGGAVIDITDGAIISYNERFSGIL